MSVDSTTNAPTSPATPSPLAEPSPSPSLAPTAASISPIYPASTSPRHIRLTSHSSGLGAIPIHWGTFLPFGVRARDLLTKPPEEYRDYVAELAPATAVETLAPGASLELSA